MNSGRPDYSERVLLVLAHIQQHLGEPLPLHELARIACFSPFHFHRIFRGMVGESVKQHVKRLRLERAAHELKATRRTVTEIALNAGYQTHESFTRAFRGAFACSPSEFRRTSAASTRLQSPAGVHFGADRVDFRPMPHEDSEMKIQIRRFEPLRVAFLRHIGPYDQVGSTWEQLADWVGAHCLFGPQTEWVGACYDDPEITPADKIRYDACVSVDESVMPEGEIGIQQVGGGEYAVALHQGPFVKLGETYAAIYGRWLPGQGREPRSAPCLEFYLNDPDSTEPEDLLTEVWVPIHPRCQ